jgi:hypothetical protein
MSKFIDWINDYSEKLGLEYSQFDWTQELDAELYDIQCSSKSNGKIVTGRGTDKDKDTAIVKATAEVLERYFLNRLTEADSSNGVAIHTERQFAELSALFELLERDSFFCHFLTKTPFDSIDSTIINEASLCRSILDLLESKGAEVRFGKMKTDYRFSAVVCAIFGTHSANGFGMTLGTSVKQTLKEGILSALLESARSAVGYLSLTSEELTTLRSADNAACSTPEHHLLVGLEPNYSERFKREFFDTPAVAFEKSELDLDDVSISSFMPLIDEDSNAINPPLYLSRASSKSLLNLYFGEFVADDHNLKRLSVFLGREILRDEINRGVHPFG